jgi:hypothetical protein
MAADKARLEAASARYEQWSTTTAPTREAAGKAKAELQHRGHEPGPAETLEPRSTLELQRESAAAGQPGPLVRHPAAQPRAWHSPRPGNIVPEQPEILGPEADHDGGRAARLDQLQAQANEAAARIEAERAELDASYEYTARIEREAQAEPEAGRQAEAPAEIEMELQ